MSKLKIPEYDGTTSVEDWVELFQLTKSALGTKWGKDDTEVAKRAALELRLALKGDLIDWYRTLDEKIKDDTEQCLQQLVVHVDGKEARHKKRAVALSLKQDDCNSATQYCTKKAALIQAADLKAIAVDVLIDGLSEEMKAWVLKEPDTQRDTMVKVTGIVKSMEGILKARKVDDSVNVTLQAEPKNDVRYCVKCGSNSHPGPWDPQCPKHDPDKKKISKNYKAYGGKSGRGGYRGGYRGRSYNNRGGRGNQFYQGYSNYNNNNTNNEKNIPNNSGAVAVNSSGKKDFSQITCHWCGGKGHLQRDCASKHNGVPSLQQKN